MLTWNSRPGSSEIVAFLDEDPPVTEAIRRLLRHETYDVVTATDAREILGLARDARLSVLAVSARGLDVLREVRASSPRTRGVLMTAGSDLPRIADALNDGTLCRLIRIPWREDELRKILRELLREPAPPPSPAPPAGPRATLRLRCRGRTTEDLVRELRESAESRPVIVLEDLYGLVGSIPGLLTELIGMTRSASIVDGTGCMNLVLDCYSRRVPLVVYGSEREIPAPRRILYIGEHTESSAFIRDLLESAGHTCVSVTSLQEGFEKMPEGADLVLLDSSLPQEVGIDVMEGLMDRGWKVPILTMSGFAARGGGEPCRTADLLHAVGSAGHE